jgi:hypothetical protein
VPPARPDDRHARLQVSDAARTRLRRAPFGALAVGLALAFGLGARVVAERILEEAYQRGQQRSQAP